MRRLLVLLWLLPGLALATTAAAAGTTTAAGARVTCKKLSAPRASARTARKPTSKLVRSKTYTVTLKTNCGDITITLDQKQSPNAAASFYALAKSGFYDKTVFHRIVPGFIIQGGDPTATGTGGPGYLTVDKPPANAAYTHGVIAMAKTGAQAAGTGGSQFFIVTTPRAPLPPDYAIFGKVTKGLDVVDAIGKFGDPSDPEGKATKVVEIEKATPAEK
jgi:cyclophilin family peptidyl-prolyl cis-trans isomerase